VAKVYVAGKFEDYHRVRHIQEIATEVGHQITFDWTQEAERVVVYGAVRNDEEGAANAEADLRGVRECHVLLAVWHPRLYGTMMEIGMTLYQQKPVWLLGSWRYSVFWHLPNVFQFPLDRQVIKTALEAAKVG